MSEYYRLPVAYDSSVGVDREAERIRGIVVMQKGDTSPLDGRKQFVDDTTMQQFVSLANSANDKQRARFTHGGVGGTGGEGLGSYLGRWSNARIDGDKVRWDLQLSPRSHDSPHGDIGKYTLDMSESDPDMLGASMRAILDRPAMDREKRADGAMPIRLRSLHGADIVDTPALASGMFAAGHHLGDEEMADSAQGGITQEQFDAGLKASFEEFGKQLAESVLAQAAEKFAAKPAEGEGDEPTAEQLRREGAKRAAQIMAFAASSGLNDHEKLANDAIEADTSVEAFKASLADRLVASNRLTDDEGEQKPDPYAKFRAEFRGDRETFAKFGVTDEDAYIRGRCDEEGLPAPTKATKAG